VTTASRPDVTAVVVNHRAAPEAALCVLSLREAFSREGFDGEIVLVDCASGEEDVCALSALACDQLVALPENRGYAGGINAGLARARGGRLLLSNADVRFLPGALTALFSEIEVPSVGAASPLCFWDEGGSLRMPPGFAPGFLRDFAQVTTGRWPALDARRFAAFARETGRLWEDGGDAGHLVGAALAVRRDVLDRVGRFDESFPFEYEETEWEDRVKAAGLTLRFVPRARAHHLFARSAVRNSETERRRAQSERIYRTRRYGALASAALRKARRLARSPRYPRISEPRFEPRPGTELAVSPNPSLLPFAGASLGDGFCLPAEVLPSLSGTAPLYLRVYRSHDGRPLETFIWERAA
jgi:GT2 family glycosyltransferase